MTERFKPCKHDWQEIGTPELKNGYRCRKCGLRVESHGDMGPPSRNYQPKR
jgi:tRNA(Ile2) C34 agmatinyltransferase TiaS